MCSARQAGIISADRHLDAIEQALSGLTIMDERGGGVFDGLIDGCVVVRSRHNEVDFGQTPHVIRGVMVNQQTAGRFHNADPFAGVPLGRSPHLCVTARRIFEQLHGALTGIEESDSASVMVLQRLLHGSLRQRLELLQSLTRFRCAHAVTDVETRQRAHAVDTIRVTEWLELRKLHVTPVLGVLSDVGGIVRRRKIGQCRTVVPDDLHGAIVDREVAIVGQCGVVG